MRRWIWLPIIIVVYFALRAPFFDHPMVGEEGTHANVFYAQPQRPDHCILGRFGDQVHYVPFNHPAMMYDLMARLGSAVSRVTDLDALSDQNFLRTGRIAFSLFQLTFWLALGLLLISKKELPPPGSLFAIVMAGLICPVAVGSAVMFQTDGTAGVLMVGLTALAIGLHSQQRVPPKVSIPVFGAAAFFLGLGKQEWGLILLIALAMTAVLSFLRKSLLRHDSWFLGVGAAGCLLGYLASHLFDPVNFGGGFHVFVSIVDKQGDGGSSSVGMASRILPRLPFVLIPGLLLCLAAVRLLTKRQPAYLLAVLFGAGLIGAYLIVQGANEYRYFATGLVASVAAAALLFPNQPGKISRAFVMALVLVSLVQYGLFYNTYHNQLRSVMLKPGQHLPSYLAFYNEKIERSQKYTCVPVLPAGRVLRNPTQVFLINSLGEANARSIAKDHRFLICP